LKRWPLIRHLRTIWAAWRMAYRYRRQGFCDPTVHDVERLERMWRGEA